jgi:hypothetical protein
MYDEPPATVELFCQRHVEPMGEESDHLHIVAITEALQVRCARTRLFAALLSLLAALPLDSHLVKPRLMYFGLSRQ